MREHMSDVALSPADRRRLLSSLMQAFHTNDRIDSVLEDIGFPAGTRPPVDGSVEASWRWVLHELETGAIPNGFRTLLEIVLERYPVNDIWLELYEQYFRDLGTGDGSSEPSEQHPCLHVMIRADDEPERRGAREYLDAQGLGPTEMWSTNHVTLYSLRPDFGTDDMPLVRERLASNHDLEWTVIPPGGPTYLYSHLLVQGPDGRFFRFTDTPAGQTVADLAADTLAQYPDSGSDRSAVMDHVQRNGQGVRLPPNVTLHEAGVRDGDQFRVGSGGHAGAINPMYHDEALVRAANQIRAFVDTHPTVSMWANAPEFATIYELEFKERSFGPPAESGEPTEIEEHTVQLEFGADFPQVAPTVFWITPIFHPNIYPNYDCDLARKSPPRQGLVCLGDLTDAYQPALDLGQLCQTLLDVAAFRNYGLVQLTGELALGDDGQYREVLKSDFFDPVAAIWVATHQDRIEEITGRKQAATPRTDSFRNVVEGYFP